jgi:4-hydroxy-tetrahydrodipicolinate synthase
LRAQRPAGEAFSSINQRNVMDLFSGIWVPLVTPFRDGRIDLPATQRLTEHIKAGGVRGIVVGGTTGEANSLSKVEQRQLLHAVRQVCGSELGVIIGVAGNATAAVAQEVAEWSQESVDGLLICAPYYVRPSQAGIFSHFETIAGHSTKPIVLYNIPYRSGVNINPQTVADLAQIPQIVAIKESGSGNVDQLFDLIEHSNLQVLSGEDSMIFLTACMGGHGAIAAAAHLRPELFVRVWQLAADGKFVASRELFSTLMPMIRVLFSEPNPGPLKVALNALGLVGEEMRLPMSPVSPHCRARVLEELRQLQAVID